MPKQELWQRRGALPLSRRTVRAQRDDQEMARLRLQALEGICERGREDLRHPSKNGRQLERPQKRHQHLPFGMPFGMP